MSRMYDRIIANFDRLPIFQEEDGSLDQGEFIAWLSVGDVVVADSLLPQVVKVSNDILPYPDIQNFWKSITLPSVPEHGVFVEIDHSVGSALLYVGFMIRRLYESGGSYSTVNPKMLIYAFSEYNHDLTNVPLVCVDYIAQVTMNRAGQILKLTFTSNEDENPDGSIPDADVDYEYFNSALLAFSLVKTEYASPLLPSTLARENAIRYYSEEWNANIYKEINVSSEIIYDLCKSIANKAIDADPFIESSDEPNELDYVGPGHNPKYALEWLKQAEALLRLPDDPNLTVSQRVDRLAGRDINSDDISRLFTLRPKSKPIHGGRLYDRILATADPSANLKGAIVVTADNVAENVALYDTVDWTEHSTCELPFDRTFVEVQRPEPPYKAWGICLWKREVGEQQFVKGALVYEREDGAFDLEVGISVEIDPEDRRPFNHRILPIGDNKGSDYKYFNVKSQQWELKERHVRAAERLLKPLFLALTLMNCNNVVLVDEYPLSALSRSYEKKYHQPLITYKTIRINPNRTIERPANSVARTETVNPRDLPMHIVRGVEADYTQGPGLFGKYHIRVWKPQHVRGNVANGAVVKDYNIQAPQEGK